MKIFKNIELFIEFQPIIFSTTKKLEAVEALLRARDVNGNLVSPGFLFEAAKKKGIIKKLDRVAIEIAIDKFSREKEHINLLFLNIENETIIDEFNKPESFIFKTCKKYSVHPENIVLEIKEDKNNDDDILFEFSSKHKELGFNIALDDFGTGSSTFDRISIVMPDIIKIDRSLINNCDTNHINQQIIKSIVSASSNIGTNILCEGSERAEEVAFCLSAGINMFQGWYFDKSTDIIKETCYFNKFSNPFSLLRKEHQKKFFLRSKILRNSEQVSEIIKDTLSNKNVEDLNFHELSRGKDIDIISFYTIDIKNNLQTSEILRVDDYKKDKTNPDTNIGYDHSFNPFFISDNYENNIPFLSDAKKDKGGYTIYSFSKVIKGEVFCLDIKEKNY